VRAVDKKPLEEWWQRFDEAENLQLDLSLRENCYEVLRDTTYIYDLAADMGGIGFIEKNKALCILSVLINTHLLMAATDRGRAALLLLVFCLRLQCGKAEESGPETPQGGGCLSSDAGRRLRVGKALQ